MATPRPPPPSQLLALKVTYDRLTEEILYLHRCWINSTSQGLKEALDLMITNRQNKRRNLALLLNAVDDVCVNFL